jgi:dCTP deaminase
MITPFIDSQLRNGNISYGLSSFGYDARVDRQFKIFPNGGLPNIIVDPKKFDKLCYSDYEGDECIIPPNSFALGRTVERFKIPRNVFVICMGKSTYARCGIIINVTPLEPEWEGTVTLEFSNTTPLPAKIYAGEGACQFIFLRGNECDVSYADRGGKYQGQTEITLPKV